MGCTALFAVAFLCLLQCDLYQATNDNTPKTIVEIIIPPCSIPNSRNQQSHRPSPACNPQLIGGCKSCQSSKQNKNVINKRKELKFRQSPVSISIPLNGVKLNIITENKPSCQSNSKKEIPTFNNIENVEVVKVLSGGNGTDDGKPLPANVYTTSNSTVTANETSGVIVEVATANVTVDNTTLEMITTLTYNNSGNSPQNTTVQTKMTAEDGQYDKSISTSDDKIDEVPKDNPSTSSEPSSKSQNPSAQTQAAPNSGSLSDKNLDSSTPPDSSTSAGKESNNEPPSSDSVPDKAVESPTTSETEPPVAEKASDESASSSEEKNPTNGNNPPDAASASSFSDATTASEASA